MTESNRQTSTVPVMLTATSPGFCPGCSGPIAVGDALAYYKEDMVSYHAQCAGRHLEDAPVLVKQMTVSEDNGRRAGELFRDPSNPERILCICRVGRRPPIRTEGELEELVAECEDAYFDIPHECSLETASKPRHSWRWTYHCRPATDEEVAGFRDREERERQRITRQTRMTEILKNICRYGVRMDSPHVSADRSIAIPAREVSWFYFGCSSARLDLGPEYIALTVQHPDTAVGEPWNEPPGYMSEQESVMWQIENCWLPGGESSYCLPADPGLRHEIEELAAALGYGDTPGFIPSGAGARPLTDADLAELIPDPERRGLSADPKDFGITDDDIPF